MNWESRIPQRERPRGVLRIGAVPFLCAEPLLYGLRNRTDLVLERAMPEALATQFAAGEFAAALMPVLDAVRCPGGRIMPGLGVVAAGGDAAWPQQEEWPHAPELEDLWERNAGLPRVLAVWAVGAAVPVAQVRTLLVRSAQEGFEHLAEIVEESPLSHGIPVPTARTYLANRLSYQLGAAEVESVRRLVSFGIKQGLCAPDTRVTFC